MGLTSARRDFIQTGFAAAQSIDAALQSTGRRPGDHARWLDFGCGAGRITRHLLNDNRLFWGVDVDASAIRWAQTHLRPGEFLAVTPLGPAPFPSDFFDVVLAASVFTHFAEDVQLHWLSEIRRLLRPGGLLIASTHPPVLTYARPDLSSAQYLELRDRGFLSAPGAGPFNEDSSFHTREYMELTWGRQFDLRSFANHGLAGYQDLSVWEKPGIDASAPIPGQSTRRDSA